MATAAACLVGAALIGACVAGCFGPPGGARGAAAALLMSLLAIGLAAAQMSAAFSGYDSDLWIHALIVERIADGDLLLSREPFRMEPPATPHQALQWIVVGLVRRFSGVETLTLIRLLGALSAILTSLAAWRFARRLLNDPVAAWGAVALLWLSMPDQWWGAGFPRAVSFGFGLLAAGAALTTTGRVRESVSLALWIALSLYSHLFGGMLAVAMVLLVVGVRGHYRQAPPAKALAAALLLGILFAWPRVVYLLNTAGLPRSPAHLGPLHGQVLALGIRWIDPRSLPGLVPWPLVALAVVGLWADTGPGLRLARSIARWGSALVALVLLTPLYHVAVTSVGGWMVVRVVALAFPWIAGALALRWLTRREAGVARHTAGMLLCLALSVSTASDLAGALLDQSLGPASLVAVAAGQPRAGPSRYLPFSREAQAEARALRGVLRERTFVSADVMAYALAAPTLGRPVAVPPGHASPFADFDRRRLWVDRAMTIGTAECWAALFGHAPTLEWLITPAPGAATEEALWRRRTAASPEAVRDLLGQLDVLTPGFRGRYFFLDAIRRPRVDPTSTPALNRRGDRLCP